MSWDKYFLDMAVFVSGKSKDKSTKVGCVFVGPDNEILSTGFNGFPRGVDDDRAERHERPEKYIWTEHAERNAIYNAARTGTSLKGAKAYVTWYPCIDCARGLAQVGVIEIICPEPRDIPDNWKDSFAKTKELFEEINMKVRFI